MPAFTGSYLPFSVYGELYDNGLVDGDELMLYYNGKLIEEVLLTKKPYHFLMKLEDHKKNELRIVMKSMGRRSPADVLLSLSGEGKRHKYAFSLDGTSNVVLTFVRKAVVKKLARDE